MGRPFPHSLEYERALLGGLIQNPTQLKEVAEGITADDFYQPTHEALFTLLLQMDAQSEPIDMVTVPERIMRDGKPDRYGGVAYVVQLPDHVPATANLGHYAGVIRQKAVLRRLIVHSQEVVSLAFDQPDDVGLLLEKASGNLFLLGQESNKRAWHRISLIIDEELLRIQKLGESGSTVVGVTTGFQDVDRKLAGLQRGDLVILAARPSMGKTALALNMAQNAAMLGGVSVGIFSLEMSRQQLTMRMLCTHAMVDAGKMRTGRLDADDWERLTEASDQLRRAGVHIDDTPGISMRELRSRARRLKQTDPNLGLIVIDYLQLMSADDPTINRTQQVSDISRGLKALAKDLDVPVMALSQLNRGVESRADKRPMLSDLRESGAIEQDADVIMFIYRDEYYNKDSTDKGLAEVIVAKQRAGETGEIKLVFQGQYTRFDDLANRDDLTL